MTEQQRCPECGSRDVELIDPETAYCNSCEFEGRAGAFEVADGMRGVRG